MLFGAMTGDTTETYFSWYFGDIYSFVPGDQYGCAIIGRVSENTGLASSETMGNSGDVATTIPGHYLARPYTGVGGSLLAGKHHDRYKGRADQIGYSGLAYSNPADGKLWASPIWLHEIAQPTVRGYMRGVWAPLHNQSNFNDGDTATGSGPLAGKTLRLTKIIQNTWAWPGCMLHEISDTWDTN